MSKFDPGLVRTEDFWWDSVLDIKRHLLANRGACTSRRPAGHVGIFTCVVTGSAACIPLLLWDERHPVELHCVTFSTTEDFSSISW